MYSGTLEISSASSFYSLLSSPVHILSISNFFLYRGSYSNTSDPNGQYIYVSGSVHAFISWHSIPLYVVYAFSAQFRNFSMSNISNRRLHVQSISRPRIFCFLNISSDHLLHSFFYHYSSCSMEKKLIRTTLERDGSVKRRGEIHYC